MSNFFEFYYMMSFKTWNSKNSFLNTQECKQTLKTLSNDKQTKHVFMCLGITNASQTIVMSLGFPIFHFLTESNLLSIPLSFHNERMSYEIRCDSLRFSQYLIKRENSFGHTFCNWDQNSKLSSVLKYFSELWKLYELVLSLETQL